MKFSEVPIGAVFATNVDRLRKETWRIKHSDIADECTWFKNGTKLGKGIITEGYDQYAIVDNLELATIQQTTNSSPPLFEYIVIVSMAEGKAWEFSCAFQDQQKAYDHAMTLKQKHPASQPIVTQIIATIETQIRIVERNDGPDPFKIGE
jgi:hypothetical protein